MRPPGFFLWVFCLATIGCGYHTAGKVTTVPENVRTIAIPAFVNQTHTYRIEQMLTAAVVREMITRTDYHIINQADADADATLKGTVLSTYTTPMTYDSQTGRAASVLVVISMSVSLKERTARSSTRMVPTCSASSTKSPATPTVSSKKTLPPTSAFLVTLRRPWFPIF